MKILQIGKYCNKFKGGVERAVMELSSALSEQHDVEVVTSNLNNRYEVDRHNNCTYHALPTWMRICSTPVTPSLISFLRKAHGFDVVLLSLQNPMAVLAYLIARPRGLLVVWYHHDIVRQKLTKRLFAPFLNKVLSLATRIIVASPEFLESSEMLKTYRNKCVVIPYGLSVDQTLPPTAKVDELREKIGDQFVLFLGRQVYYKGLPCLLRAMTQVTSKLVIAGSGPLKEKLKKQACMLGVSEKVIFFDAPNDMDAATLLEACELLVLPSTHRTEAFGLVMLEAMARGKPVVTTELGTGTSYVCKDGETGLVVAPNDETALANALNSILADPTLATRLGGCGRKRFENTFTLKQVVPAHLKLYSMLLDSHESNNLLGTSSSNGFHISTEAAIDGAEHTTRTG